MEPLGPAEKEHIQKVDQQLGDLIQEMNAGKHNEGRLFYIGQQLSVLSKSKNIPDGVKLKLQTALKELQADSFASLNVYQIAAAKKQVDEVLEGPEKPS